MRILGTASIRMRHLAAQAGIEPTKFLREREVTVTNLSTGPFMKLETSEGIEPTLNQFCRLTPMPVLGKMPKVRGKDDKSICVESNH